MSSYDSASFDASFGSSTFGFTASSPGSSSRSASYSPHSSTTSGPMLAEDDIFSILNTNFCEENGVDPLERKSEVGPSGAFSFDSFDFSSLDGQGMMEMNGLDLSLGAALEMCARPSSCLSSSPGRRAHRLLRRFWQ